MSSRKSWDGRRTASRAGSIRSIWDTRGTSGINTIVFFGGVTEERELSLELWHAADAVARRTRVTSDAQDASTSKVKRQHIFQRSEPE